MSLFGYNCQHCGAPLDNMSPLHRCTSDLASPAPAGAAPLDVFRAFLAAAKRIADAAHREAVGDWLIHAWHHDVLPDLTTAPAPAPAPPQPQGKEREAFEAWVPTDPVARAHADNSRDLALIQHGWQARASQVAPEVASTEAEIDNLGMHAGAVAMLRGLGFVWAGGEWSKVAPEVAQPTGYVLVPVEPTQRMIEAAFDAVSSSVAEGSIRARYRAMLAAAPQAVPDAYMNAAGGVISRAQKLGAQNSGGYNIPLVRRAAMAKEPKT